MQRVGAQVTAIAVDSRATGSGARSHYFEHPVGNLQADLAGGHLRGGDVQSTTCPREFLTGKRVRKVGLMPQLSTVGQLTALHQLGPHDIPANPE
jgi:hypothetical protein